MCRPSLVIDLDPQTNASFSMIGVAKWEEHSLENGTIADLLGAKSHTSAEGTKKTAADVIYKNAFKNVDLIPSHIDLFTVDLDLAGATSRETKLKKALKDSISNYDIIICDCPPNLTIPTQNALALSTHYVIPVSLDFLSAIGVSLLIKRVEELTDDLDKEISLAGIVISRVGRPAIHREETEATLRSSFSGKVLTTTISERVAISKCAELRQSVFESTDQTAKQQFGAVSKEILERID